jgi:hypothetical protein
MTKIILHIGLEKTGTTTIQRVFNSNRELLLSKGIYYPSYFGEENHVCLYNYAKAKDAIDELRIYSGIKSADDVLQFRTDFKKLFINDLKSKKPKYLVLSNEHLSSRLSGTEGLERLKELLESISKDIQVVLYVRNIFDFLVSSYSTAVKCGETKKFIDYVPDKADLPFRYQLSSVLKLWFSVFGENNVLVRPFSREHLISGDILSDFVSAAKLPISIDSLKVSLKAENVSLGREGLDLVRRLNNYLPLIKDGAYNSERGDLVDRIQGIENYKPMTLSENECKKVLKSFEDEDVSYSRALPKEFSEAMSLANSKYFGRASPGNNSIDVDELMAGLWVDLRK